MSIFWILLVTTGQVWSAPALEPLILMVAYDGLRYDYITPELTPTLYKLAQEGAFAEEGMRPQFVTTTMLNFMSISTGLYGEEHGLISNRFYDPVYEQTYDYWNQKDVKLAVGSWDEKWYHGVPLWTLNEQREGRHSGCMEWPGCYHEPRPTFSEHWFDYGNLTIWKAKMQRTLSWFFHPVTPINLGFFYIAEPDHTEHGNDITGPEVQAKIKEVDDLTAYLLSLIEQTEKCFQKRLHLIFLADHGHVNVRFPEDYVELKDYIDEDTYEKLRWNGWSLMPKPGEEVDMAQVYADANNGKSEQEWDVSVYAKEDIPERYHWGDNRRIGNVTILANLGKNIVYNLSAMDPNTTKVVGNHGYSNDHKEMNAFFIASGPRFRKKQKLAEFDNIDVYPVVAKLLNFKCIPKVNGSYLRLGPQLLNRSNWASFQMQHILYLAAVGIFLRLLS